MRRILLTCAALLAVLTTLASMALATERLEASTSTGASRPAASLDQQAHVAADPKIHYGFPRVVQAANGNLLVFYRVGTSHAYDDSRIAVRGSTDEGKSWSAERILWKAEPGFSAHNPVAMVTPSGKILLWVSAYRYSSKPRARLPGYWSESLDHGETWSPFVRFDNDPNRSVYYITDAIVASDGLLIAGDVHPAGGIGDCRTLLFHSTDDGRSWSVRSALTGVEEDKGDEVALLETRPGELLCLLRDRQRKDIYRFWSRDAGRTWSKRESIRDMLDCTLQRPFLTRVSDDSTLLSGRDFGRKEVVAFVSRDGGRTFAERQTIDSYQGDGGYTAAVRLNDSSVRIVWYADSGATLNMPDVKSARLTIPDRSAEASPLFSFGLVADVQYADKPDRPPRLYRASLERLRECVTELNRHELTFTIQLGDLIDGNDGLERTHEDLDRVLTEFAKLDTRIYHVVGNHCLKAGRETLLDKLTLARPYYDFVPEGVSGWRMVVLDGNDAGYGVLGEEQTAWLKQALDKARRSNERVILFNHFAVLKKAAARHRMKTPEPLQSIITQSGCVVAYFAGHDHAGGYAEDGGIQHVTFQGMVESTRKNAYAIVGVFDDRIEIRGFGKVPSRSLALLAPALPKTAERGAGAADRGRVTAPAAGSGGH